MDTTRTTADPPTLEREVRIAARPETVFAYFVDPERMARWMGNNVVLDARPGGTLRIDYNGRDIARGEFIAIDPPWRVVFTWGWEMPDDPVPPGASTVEVTLAPDGDGTTVRLVHSGLPADTIGGHAEGWDQFLPALAAAAEADAAA